MKNENEASVPEFSSWTFIFADTTDGNGNWSQNKALNVRDQHPNLNTSISFILEIQSVLYTHEN